MRETNARVFIIYARLGGEVYWKATVTFAQPRNPNHLRSSTTATATAIIIRTISFPILLSYEHEQQQQQHNGNFNSQFTQYGLFGFS